MIQMKKDQTLISFFTQNIQVKIIVCVFNKKILK